MIILQRQRHHAIAQANCAVDEWANGLTITTQKDGVKVGDTVEVSHLPGVIFEVARIDYYSDPSDMFVAEIFLQND
jgi:hypothetical protein